MQGKIPRWKSGGSGLLPASLDKKKKRGGDEKRLVGKQMNGGRNLEDKLNTSQTKRPNRSGGGEGKKGSSEGRRGCKRNGSVNNIGQRKGMSSDPS